MILQTVCILSRTSGIQREINVKRQKLGSVTSFKYLGAVFHIMAQNQKFSQGLRKSPQLLQSGSRFGEVATKVKPMHSLVIAMFLYACDSGVFMAELEQGRQAFEMRCY